MGIMAMGSSPMVPQRAEQSQLLVQQPDAPSPAQPQVHDVVYSQGSDCNRIGIIIITFGKSKKLPKGTEYIYITCFSYRELGLYFLL